MKNQVTIAKNVQEYVDSWMFVYDRYLDAGIIGPNDQKIHTNHHAVQDKSVVVFSKYHGDITSTLTGCLDQDQLGLPLDSVFSDCLNGLRSESKIIMEVGLFACSRPLAPRSLFELVRYVTYFGLFQGATDAVFGVHPDHKPFYLRMLGLEQLGDVRSYKKHKDHPVVLLHLDWRVKTNLFLLQPGILYIKDNPLSEEDFDSRCVLTHESISDTPIGQFLYGGPRLDIK